MSTATASLCRPSGTSVALCGPTTRSAKAGVSISDHALFLVRELNRSFFVQHPNFFYQTVGPASDVDGVPARFMLQLQVPTLRYTPVTNYEHATWCKPSDSRDIRLLTMACFINEALSFGANA